MCVCVCVYVHVCIDIPMCYNILFIYIYIYCIKPNKLFLELNDVPEACMFLAKIWSVLMYGRVAMFFSMVHDT